MIDGTGSAPFHDGVLLIQGGRIAAVGRSAEVVIPDSSTRIDARGKYVVPGLLDAAIMLFAPELETLIRYEGRYHEIFVEAAQLALKNGQTSVVVPWGPRAPLVQARDMINTGSVPGSRIYLAGNIIGLGGPFSASFFSQWNAHVNRAFAERSNEAWEQGVGRNLSTLTPEEIRPIIKDYAQKQVDYLQYASSGYGNGTENFIAFSVAAQKAIIEEGHRAGIAVQAHTMSVPSLDLAIDAGVDSLSHGDISGIASIIPPQTIRKLVERKIAVGISPATQRHVDALEKEMPGEYAQLMRVAKVNRRNMIKAGVTMLMGTQAFVRSPAQLAESAVAAETSVHGPIGEAHFYALLALEEEGMAPMEILRTATSHVARAYKLDRELGTLEPGKLADLLILDANPLASARHYRRIHTIIKNGQLVDRDALPVVRVFTVNRVQARSVSARSRLSKYIPILP
jgi:imidazolonepropionase-like amidohydrolase